MNKHKFLILGMTLALFAASCRKNDVEGNKKTAAEAAAVQTTEWRSAADWSSSKEEKYTSYSTTLQDKSITSDVVENGIVLVYAKYGNEVFSLPHQVKGAVDAFWHYQVSENTISIDVDVYSDNATIDNKQTFSYFILSADKIKSLESNGHTVSDLITLTYENAQNLLK
jgi:hypothetical protein